MTPRRFVTVIGALTATTALAWGALGTFSVEAQEKPAKISRAHEADFGPDFQDPIYMLVLGGDARTGNPDRVLMDSIHIVSVDPETKTASILGIPRDSYVQIPGRGRNKINSAGVFGGPELMVQTVEELSGCRFDYYMLTSFQGFVRVINDFGGVPFEVPAPLKDRFAKLDVRAGKQRFDGNAALGWSRSRKFRPRGDFDRSHEQGNIMKAVHAEAIAKSKTDAGIPLRSLATLRRNLKLNIPMDEAFRLGLLMLKIPNSSVTNIVMDGAVGTVDGSSVVTVTGAGRNQLVDICEDGRLGS